MFMLIDKKGLNLCHGRIIMMVQPKLMIIIVITHISLLRDFVLLHVQRNEVQKCVTLLCTKSLFEKVAIHFHTQTSKHLYG